MSLIVQGVQYAWDVSHHFKTFLLLHVQLDNPLSVSKVLHPASCPTNRGQRPILHPRSCHCMLRSRRHPRS